MAPRKRTAEEQGVKVVEAGEPPKKYVITPRVTRSAARRAAEAEAVAEKKPKAEPQRKKNRGKGTQKVVAQEEEEEESTDSENGSEERAKGARRKKAKAKGKQKVVAEEEEEENSDSENGNEEKAKGAQKKNKNKGKGKQKVVAKDDEEESTDSENEKASDKTIVIEHCTQCTSFKKRAEQVKKGLEDGVSGISVLVNPNKPRRGCFEIREEGGDGEKFISLLEMKRPFKPMKDLDMAQVIEDIIEKIK